MLRSVIVAILGFIAGAVATYLVVVFGTVLVWDLAGVHDQDGGGAMALGLVVGPAIAMIGGLAAVLALLLWDGKRRRNAPPQTPEARAHDSHRLLIAGGAIAGGIAGYVLAGQLFYYTGLVRLDHLLAVLLPTILTLLGALAGGWLVRRWLRLAC